MYNIANTNDRAIGAETLKICVSVPLSCIGAALGREMANAIQLAVDGTNAAGGIYGKPIEAVILDDKATEEDGERLVKELVDDPATLAAIGHYNSNVTLRVAPIYSAGGCH